MVFHKMSTYKTYGTNEANCISYFCNVLNFVIHQLKSSILKTRKYDEKTCDFVSAICFVDTARL